jgi:hypothetical protein
MDNGEQAVAHEGLSADVYMTIMKFFDVSGVVICTVYLLYLDRQNI